MQLPLRCGLKDDNLRLVAQGQNQSQKALGFAQRACSTRSMDHLMSLYYCDRCISECSGVDDKSDAICARVDIERADGELVLMFPDASVLEVNSYITSQCADYLAAHDIPNALECVERATDAAVALYKWAKQGVEDELVMADIEFFVRHTPAWCYRFSRPALEDDNILTREARYISCVRRIVGIFE